MDSSTNEKTTTTRHPLAFFCIVTCMCVFTERIRWNDSETPTVHPRLSPRVSAFAENLSHKEKTAFRNSFM
jgi:hypothetical protein